MINRMLEVEDVEEGDVFCTVDGMKAMDRSESLIQRGWSEGWVGTRDSASRSSGWEKIASSLRVTRAGLTKIRECRRKRRGGQ
jgi:hypothetical protein